MNALQQATIETIKNMPVDCSVDDIMSEVNFIGQVYEGIDDADSGKLVSTEELLLMVAQWGKFL